MPDILFCFVLCVSLLLFWPFCFYFLMQKTCLLYMHVSRFLRGGGGDIHGYRLSGDDIVLVSDLSLFILPRSFFCTYIFVFCTSNRCLFIHQPACLSIFVYFPQHTHLSLSITKFIFESKNNDFISKSTPYRHTASAQS